MKKRNVGVIGIGRTPATAKMLTNRSRSTKQRGDPYATHVKRTTAALVRQMGWPRQRWTQSFQSLFGRDMWLKPYTDDTLVKLAKAGVKRVFVGLPGFTADCLETLDEIGNESRHVFLEAGGEQLHACRCLNDHPAWIEALSTMVLEEGNCG